MNVERTLRLEAPPDDVDVVHDLVEDLWRASPDVDPMDRMAFETALIELASNVIRHADSGDGVTCVIVLEVTDGELRASLRDSSEAGGIVLGTIEMPDDFDAESGRGLALVQALADEFRHEHTDGVNSWIFSRRRTAAPR